MKQKNVIENKTVRQVRPRKLPSQKRARENVERILSAAATLLERDGYDRLTTITIANEAGTSVGSLYQYFPNKHAIMTALFERWLNLDNQALEVVENRRQYDNVIDEFLDLTAQLVENYSQQKGLLALVKLSQTIPELFDIQEQHDKQYARRLAKIVDRYDVHLPDDKKLALAGYFTIIVDAVAMSIATETEERAKFKMEFLNHSVRDLFLTYMKKNP